MARARRRAEERAAQRRPCANPGCGETFEPTQGDRQRFCENCTGKHAGEFPQYVGVVCVRDKAGRLKAVVRHNGRVSDRLDIEDPDHEPWRQVFPWLYSRFRPFHIYVTVELPQATAQWFRGLPPGRQDRLFTPKARIARQRTGVGQDGNEYSYLLPVDLDRKRGTWQATADIHDQLKFRPSPSADWMTLCGVDGYLPEDLDFPADPADRAALLVKIGDRIRRTLDTVGVKLDRDQHYGPGAAAQELLKAKKAPRRYDIERTLRDGGIYRVWGAAREAWYAGWFDTPQHGPIPGRVFDYDINSAYPYQMSMLPCLLCGKWRHKGETTLDRLPPLPPGGIQLVRGEARGSNPYVGALSHRSHGDHGDALLRPHITRGWWHRQEIDAVVYAGTLDTLDVEETWTFTPRCDHQPFGWIRDVYTERAKFKAAHKESGSWEDDLAAAVLKLTPNSAYGKTCQQVGAATFQNWIYAGRITAGTTAMVLRAAADHPDGLAALTDAAVDGFACRGKHPSLKLGKGLGEWKLASPKDGYSGYTVQRVHWAYDDNGWFKASGVPGTPGRPGEAGRVVNELRPLWKQCLDDALAGRPYALPSVPAKLTGIVPGPGAAAARRHRQLGAVETRTYPISADVSGRQEPYFDGEVFRSHPLTKPDTIDSAKVRLVGQAQREAAERTGLPIYLSNSELLIQSCLPLAQYGL